MYRYKNTRSGLKQGFTTVEMLIIAPVVLLFIGVFVVAIVTMLGNVLTTRAHNVLAYNTQDTLSRIESDIKASGGFLSVNNIVLQSPQGYNNDTTNFYNASTTNGPALILNMYATDSNPSGSSARKFIYAKNSPYACNDAKVNQNTRLTYNIVYFIKNGTLWRRVLMPSGYNDTTNTVCTLPWQKPSCNPENVTGFCTTEDVKLIEGITATDFVVTYSNNGVVNADASDPNKSYIERQTALSTVNNASVSLTATSNIAGSDVSQTGSLNTTSPNINIPVPRQIQLLLVGGGGQGGYAGGGGAGAMITSTLMISSDTTYNITVGAGGSGVTSSTTNGGSGATSAFGSTTATGGGGGGSVNNAGSSSVTASGGGGGANSLVGGIFAGGVGANVLGRGYSGGANSGVACSPSGGGGGAGSAGSVATTTPGAGGAGYQNNITGTNIYYAGGGGGGSACAGTALGGSSIGGTGAVAPATGNIGAANTGSGGGGGGIGGIGGSGVVIVKILSSIMTTCPNCVGSPNITYVNSSGTSPGPTPQTGGYTIFKFTTSGTFISP
ncbi:hypothetical protein HGB25_01995 [Candidatus Saccharibacteria bacterium]|nr:hypothetical protein [Candidatus Saccharibacteria bacterium]